MKILNCSPRRRAASHAEATHESSKPENKYDTRGLEAAYLAGGQARQVREIMESIKTYQALPIKDFSSGEPIDLTALVTLQINQVESVFFIGPKSGGLEIEVKKQEVVVITPQSPLGQMLMGKTAGERWQVKAGKVDTVYQIMKVI